MSYVVRLGSFGGDGPYIRARANEDWTITFDQRRAIRFDERHYAELIAGEFGDARPVRLRQSSQRQSKDPA